MQQIYLSNPVKEEVRIILSQVTEQHYKIAVDFLRMCLEKWQKTTSVDGKIKSSVQTDQSPCKTIQVEYRPNIISISFYGVPMIRENRWDNLIQTVADALVFPNAFFKANNHIVTNLVALVKCPNRAVVYKALLEICQPFMIDEITFKVLQTAAIIPTQSDLEEKENIIFVNQYYYEEKQIPLPAAPVIQPQVQVQQPQQVIGPQRPIYINIQASYDSLDQEDKNLLNEV